MKRIKVLKIPVELMEDGFLQPLQKYYRGITDTVGRELAELLNLKLEYDIIKDTFREVSDEDYAALINYIRSVNQRGARDFNYIVFVDDYHEDEDFDALLQLAKIENEKLKKIKQEKEEQERLKKATADKKREEANRKRDRLRLNCCKKPMSCLIMKSHQNRINECHAVNKYNTI